MFGLMVFFAIVSLSAATISILTDDFYTRRRYLAVAGAFGISFVIGVILITLLG